MAMQERDCEQCGKRYRGRGLSFCGNSCQMTWFNLRNNPAKSDAARAKVSAARKGKATTTGRILPKSQKDNISKALRGRTLTDEHKAAIRETVIKKGIQPPADRKVLRGPEHPCWKGGHSPARQADYRNPAYIAFRRAVQERDDWTCQSCGKRGGRIEVHHIKSWAEHPGLRYEPSNGQALCRPCHNQTKRCPRPTNAGPRTRADLRSDQT
jgi:5-methylcytosine-specific restriction endonuclease McrA